MLLTYSKGLPKTQESFQVCTLIAELVINKGIYQQVHKTLIRIKTEPY
jgi:hypothetical protein